MEPLLKMIEEEAIEESVGRTVNLYSSDSSVFYVPDQLRERVREKGGHYVRRSNLCTHGAAACQRRINTIHFSEVRYGT